MEFKVSREAFLLIMIFPDFSSRNFEKNLEIKKSDRKYTNSFFYTYNWDLIISSAKLEICCKKFTCKKCLYIELIKNKIKKELNILFNV